MNWTDSPLAGRMIFVCGARRSGTYWLQQVISSHPDVAAIPSETLLFSHGIAPFIERFHHGARESTQTAAVYAHRAELIEALRLLCDRVFLEFAAPGVGRVLERSSLHVNHLDLMGEVYPDARFLHIIRDGRDVARSLVAQRWGPDTVAEAAQEWRDSVRAGRRDAPPHYHEIRYEELVADPERWERELFEWLGLTAGVAALAAATAAAATPVNVDFSSPVVGAGKWRTSFSAADVDEFDHVAGDLLAELGYPPGDLVSRAPVKGGLRPALRRVRAALRDRSGPRQAVSPTSEYHLVLTMRAFDEVLGCLHTGRMDRLDELLSDDVVVQFEQNGSSERAEGRAGRELLRERIAADPAFRGRQVRGEVLHGAPTIGARLRYELPNSDQVDREVTATIYDEVTRSLTVRIP